MELHKAEATAHELVRLLKPACTRIVVAGSIRRRRALVKDIDLVCEPRMDVPDGQLLDLGERVNALERHVERLLAAEATELGPALRLNPEHPANGPRHKRLLWRKVPVELWIVLPPACWGAQLAIRTGPGDFSRAMVTRRSEGGGMPDELQQRDGALWRGNARITTDSEAEYFSELGLPLWPPAERTERLLRDQVRSMTKGVGHVGSHKEARTAAGTDRHADG